MATKQIEVAEIGRLHLYKRKGARHIRLSINAAGKIRVTLPTWVPYSAGIAFAQLKSEWLKLQAPPILLFKDNTPVGKLHRMHFEAGSSAIRTRVTETEVIVKLPAGTASSSEAAQKAAHRASVKALKDEAETFLPRRLRNIAATYGFEFKSVEVKQLKSRWGSCNHHKEIVLNCYLMQLPWRLIDYVLLHELMHTRIMAHGPRFWTELEAYVPDLKQVRKEMRARKARLQI